MKKLLRACAFLVCLGGVSGLYANYQSDCCDQSGFSVEGEYLFWKTYREQLPFSGTIESNPFGDVVNTVPVDADSYKINIADTDYCWDSGFRVALGYGCCNDWQVKGRYTWFRDEGNRNLGSLTTTGTAFANLMDRSLANVAGFAASFAGGIADTAKESIELKLHMGDLEYEGTYDGCDYKMTYSGGIRYISLDQEKDIQYAVANSDTYSIKMSDEMTGWGLRTATEFLYPMLCDGFSLYGKGAFSILLGDFDLKRTDEALNATANDVEIRSYCQSYCAMVPMLEVGAGLNFEYCGFNLRMGYEFVNMCNMFQHFDFPGWDDVNGNTPQVRVTDGSVSFGGMFIALNKCF